MSNFLTDAGFRVLSVSRPGYLHTPLTDHNGTPDGQADLWAVLVDELKIAGKVGVVCWAGGGPSSYRFAVKYADKVNSLVAISAVSKSYQWKRSMNEKMMESWVGGHVVSLFKSEAPEALVKSTLDAVEGKMDNRDLKALQDHVIQDSVKKQFVLDLAATITTHDRSQGLTSDQQQFAASADLELGMISVPVLLVHGTLDSAVPLDHSKLAKDEIQGAEYIEIERGGHIGVWTDPTTNEVQGKIVEFLRRHSVKADSKE